MDNPLAYERAELRLVHGFGLLVRGWLKLIVSWPLVADYSPKHIPLFTDWSEPEIVWPFLLVATLVGCVYRLAKQSPEWVLWIGISGGAILIVSNLFIATGTIFAERLLYIPSMGISLFLGWGLGKLKAGVIRWILGGWIVIAVGILMSLILVGIVKIATPDKPLGEIEKRVTYKKLLSEGDIFLANGNWNSAQKSFEKASVLMPGLWTPYFKQGIIFGAQNKFEQAEKYYRAGLEIYPDHPSLLANYGATLAVLEKFNETAVHTERSGFGIITDKDGSCIGVVSDGDIRRKLIEDIFLSVYEK